jgi:hypothetical protein
MTVDVEVDGKVHSGSSVIEVGDTRQPRTLPDAGLSTRRVTGQAVYVDLGKGRNVVALLASGPEGRSNDFPAWIVLKHFNLAYPWTDYIKMMFLRGRWQLDMSETSYRPTLVTFEDPHDSKTAKIVEPADFPKVFGSGVKPPTVTIEMTGDRVTRDLSEKLPWMKHFKSGTLGGTLKVHSTDVSEPGKFLTWGVFVRGMRI